LFTERIWMQIGAKEHIMVNISECPYNIKN